MKERTSSKMVENLSHLGPAILVMALSMWFFLYLGRQKAMATYPVQQLDKVADQGRLIKGSIESFLFAGVPLRQFAGFSVLAQRQMALEPDLEEIQAIDNNGQILFSARGIRSERGILPANLSQFQRRPPNNDASFLLDKDDAAYRVILPLSNKFEQEGSLQILVSKSRMLEPMEALFDQLSLFCVLLIVVFTSVLYWLREILLLRQKWLLVAVYLPFLVFASLAVNWGLQDLNIRALANRIDASANNFAFRLNHALELGLTPDDFGDLDLELAFIKNTLPNVQRLACILNGTIVADSEGELVSRSLIQGKGMGLSEVPTPHDTSPHMLLKMRDNIIRSGIWQTITTYALPFFLTILISSMLLFLVDHYLAVGFRTLKVPATFVLSLAFLLLFYVGLGEAFRGYPRLCLEKLAAEGESIRLGMEGFLKAGVPLRQFGGFKTLAEPLLAADEAIHQIQVLDTHGDLIFAARNERNLKRKNAIQHQGEYTSVDMESAAQAGHDFSVNEGFYRVSLPLQDKFEAVGSLALTVERNEVVGPIEQAFEQLAYKMVGLIALFVVMLMLGDRFLGQRIPNIPHLCYGTIFLVAAGFVTFTLVDLYSNGIEAKTRALSLSLGKRLEAATTLGLPLSGFSGIDDSFHDYMKYNPELSSVTLVEGNTVRIHSDEQRVGSTYRRDPKNFVHTTQLAGVDSGESLFSVTLSIPREEVRARLVRAIKNFIVLFLATALLAALFLNLVTIIGQQRKAAKDNLYTGNLELALVKVLFFLVVFVEGLFSSFLPLYLQDVARTSGLTANSASVLFTAYFAAFALSLIPSGHYTERQGVKSLMVWGVLLTAASAYGMTLVDSFYWVMFLRILAGISQGMIFISVQAFVLQITSGGKTTQGTSVIVYGYNTGMISGTAIGALLVLYMGSMTVFRIGSLISLFIFGFILYLIPDVGKKTPSAVHSESKMAALGNWFKMVGVLFKDFQFIKTIILIGLTTKATMTGIIVYALPLIMARLGYPQDDIGQALMFYAAGVLLSNLYIPKLADRLGNTAVILFWGCIGSSLSLLCMALVGLPFLADESIAQTFLLIFGIFLLGIAHGFIHAPIVTHIAFTSAAEKLGKAATTSIYRFLERIGHVMGPIIVGQLLIIGDYDPVTFGYVGGALVICGLLFLLFRIPTGGNRRPSLLGESL